VKEKNLRRAIRLATDNVPARCFDQYLLRHLFENEYSVFHEETGERLVSQELFRESFSRFGLFVRRIGKHDIESGFAGPSQKFKYFLLSRLAFEFRFREIFFDGRDRLPILIKEKDRISAATERLNTKRSRSGKKIEDARVENPIGQTGKNGGFDPVHGRSDAALRDLELDSASGTRDHSHGAGDEAASAGVAEPELSAPFSAPGVSAGGAAF
jgi:hypothetical protein